MSEHPPADCSKLRHGPRTLFFIGCVLVFAAIGGSYSVALGLLGLGLAYYLFRGSRWIRDEETLFPGITLPDYRDSDFEILGESEDELVLRGSTQALIVNRRTRTVSNIKRVLCSFDRIECIRIDRSSTNNDGYNAGYSVSLSLGFLSSISLGESSDMANASSAAARLATWTGKPVVN